MGLFYRELWGCVRRSESGLMVCYRRISCPGIHAAEGVDKYKSWKCFPKAG